MNSNEQLLFHVLLEFVVIIVAARAGGWLLGRLGQPQVVGEIFAGLVLGPTLLGRAAPELSDWIFSAETQPFFGVMGHVGLVLMMFLVGLEFEFGHLRKLGGAAAGVAFAGVALPFIMGLGVARLIQPSVAPEVPALAFELFLATALSITAIPVLARIMLEYGITRTRLGALTITAAAIDDVLGWILLAAVGTTVTGVLRLGEALATLALTLAFLAAVVLLLRPLFTRWARQAFAPGGSGLGLMPFSILLATIFACAATTSFIGIFSLIGAFTLGAALWDQDKLRVAVSARMSALVEGFFLPIFFTYTGMHTDVGTLDSPIDWAICALIVVVAIVGKTLGTGYMAYRGGLTWRESASVAVLMNTRALMGLVVINIGRDLGLIPPELFTMLVLMALITTFMTSPLLSWLQPRER